MQFAPENLFTSDRGSVYFGQPSLFFIDAVEDTTVVLLDQHFIETALEYHKENFSKHDGNFQMVQLWVNLPAKDKMSKPKYQGISNAQIAKYALLIRVESLKLTDTKCLSSRNGSSSVIP